MTVTHTPIGFTGTVDEVAFAKLMAYAAPRFRVTTPSDWAVSVSGSTNRTINIAAGTGYACGVYDSTTAADTVAFATNSGGTNRYDALVATFTWGSDTVTFQAIAGTTSPPAVNTTTTVDNAKINRIPGVRYDALLAVVQVRPSVGLFTSGDLFDMRPYGGKSGSLMLPNSTYLSLIDAGPGSEVYAVDTGQRWQTLDGSTWTWPPEPQGELGRAELTTSSSGVLLASSLTGLPSLTVTTSFIPANRRIRLTLLGNIIPTAASSAYSFYLFQGAVGTSSQAVRSMTINAPLASVAAPVVVPVTVNTTGALTNQQWTVAGAQSAGSGTVSLFGGAGLGGPVQYIVEDVGAV